MIGPQKTGLHDYLKSPNYNFDKKQLTVNILLPNNKRTFSLGGWEETYKLEYYNKYSSKKQFCPVSQK
jgi:hypothetical protein